MRDPNVRCDNCEWWDEEEAEGWADGTSWCRRFPPFIRPLKGDRLDSEDVRPPVVLKMEYCGEFTPRKPRLSRKKPKK